MAKPFYIGKDSILNYFDKSVNKKLPIFSVQEGNSIHLSYSGKDYEEAKELLSDWLDDCSENNYDNNVYIYLHNPIAKGDVFNKKNHYNTKLVQPVEKIHNTDSSSYYLKKEIDSLKSELNALKEVQINSDTEEEEEEPQSIMGFVNGLLKQDEIKTMLISGISTWINNKVFKSNNVAIAGSVTEQKSDLTESDIANLNKYIAITLQKGATIEHYKKLSEMETSQFQMLLKML